MLSFQSEKWPDIKRDFEPLGRLNFAECQIAEGQRPYALDETTIDALDKLGMVHFTTARQGQQLVGYVFNMVMPRHLQFEAKCSQQIGLYLLPEYRKGVNGLKLLAEDESYMRALGVQKMYRGDTIGKDLGPLFKRAGWLPVETVYTKWVENG